MTEELPIHEDPLGDEEPPREHGTRNFLAGLALGALVGAGFALLFAPERGSDIRRKLGRRFRHMRDEAEETYGSLKEDLERRKRKLS